MKYLCLFLSLVANSHVVLSNMNFLVLGDWGGAPAPVYSLPAQKATAEGMGIIGEQLNTTAVLAIGDNFYFNGIIGDSDNDRFEKTWNSVYSADSLQVPWLLLAGNHDHYGNITAQIEYTTKSDRWIFPSIYHKQSFTYEEGYSVDFILIDTIDLAGVTEEMDESDPKYFESLPFRSKSEASEQWNWIEDQMSSSTADYLIVAGHYPVYSVCEHGNTQNLIDNLRPLLKQYNAHYLAGHDHCMENLVDPELNSQGNEIFYMVSGMGDFCCYDNSNIENVPEGSLRWYVSKQNKEKSTQGGFSSLSFSTEALIMTFYDQNGKILYKTPSIAPRLIN